MTKRYLLYVAERPVTYGYNDPSEVELIPLFAIEAVDKADATWTARRHLAAVRDFVSFSDPDTFTHRTVEVLPSGYDTDGRRLNRLEYERAHDVRMVSERVARRRRRR